MVDYIVKVRYIMDDEEYITADNIQEARELVMDEYNSYQELQILDIIQEDT